MVTVITTSDSKTYNSKESLKAEGFVFDTELKIWSKEYDSIEDFNNFETNKFRSVTYGRRQARENESVRFEVLPEINKTESTVIYLMDEEERLYPVRVGKPREIKAYGLFTNEGVCFDHFLDKDIAIKEMNTNNKLAELGYMQERVSAPYTVREILIDVFGNEIEKRRG